MKFICPICGKELNKAERSYVCEANHSFDIARQGYVNLLTICQGFVMFRSLQNEI